MIYSGWHGFLSSRGKTMRQEIQLSGGKKFRVKTWEIALLALLLSGISRLTASRSSPNAQRFYGRSLKQAPWAPPGWLFGPAWTINNFFLLLALVRILAMKKGPAKNKLLAIQIFVWVIFYSFDYVYFKKESPFLAAIWTHSDSVLALMSLVIGWKEDRELGACYLPLTLWTLYAGTVADFQWANNPDPVLGWLR
jgi:translocator protein